MAQRVVRFGVIGCGLMGREFASAAARWLHLLDHPARPEIVAVCDANLGATDWFAQNLPTVRQVTSDYRELLANPDVEAIYCAVPHHLHEALYVDIVSAGKHLLAEKPFGIDLPACERILAAIDARPEVLVRCSSEFPFYPAVQRIARMVREEAFGRILEVHASFNHSSDLDPNKPINWKRQVRFCGEYGCMGDLGMHVLHFPLRFGWVPTNVRALLSNVVPERPDGKGGMAPCDTWDNATLACETIGGFPMVLETKRISPGDTDTWTLRILGTRNSAEFTTKLPKTLRTMPYEPGRRQAWLSEDLGYESAYRTITGHIFEFGFTDAILQMWAAFLDELAGNEPPFGCVTPREAYASHRIFTGALASARNASAVALK
jgi:predicted dehydrogenase